MTLRRPDPASDVPGSTREGLAASPLRLLDGLAFSSAIAAFVGASLCLAAGLALEATAAGRWALIAAGGTFIVYNLDRLRDVARDRATSPVRTAFVEAHAGALWAAIGLAAIGVAAALVGAPPRVVGLYAAVGLVGLLHRRLKGRAAIKALYVSLAWLLACAGPPFLTGGAEGDPSAMLRLVWVASALLSGLIANLIASNLRDGETQVLRGRPGQVLWIARATALAGAAGVALLAPGALPALAWIPFCQALALARFRPTERYGHIAVDGALGVGAAIAITQLVAG